MMAFYLAPLKIQFTCGAVYCAFCFCVIGNIVAGGVRCCIYTVSEAVPLRVKSLAHWSTMETGSGIQMFA